MYSRYVGQVLCAARHGGAFYSGDSIACLVVGRLLKFDRRIVKFTIVAYSSMPKRSSKPKTPTDPNLLARQIVEEAIGEPITPLRSHDGKNPAAVALGRLGGLKGGKARAAKLSAKKRQEIAKRAARARWAAKQS
jgi:hypothetical protein